MASDIIVIEKALLKSEAFRGLSSTAKDVYFAFLMKCQITMQAPKPGRKKEKIILNNGKLEFTYSEAEKKGIPRSTFMDCIDQLIQRGFIYIQHSGSGGKKGDKSLYGISDRWKAWGTDEFVHAKRPKDTRQGRGFARVWKQRQSSNIGIVDRNPTVTVFRN